MPRTALTLATCSMLLLNGSMALAMMPAPSRCGDVDTVCVISLRMMEPPPQRPVDLMTRNEVAGGRVVLASSAR